MKYSLRRLAFVFAIVAPSLTFSQALPTQPAVSKSLNNRCEFSEVFENEGWKIPGVVGATANGNRASVVQFPGVFVTKLNAGTSALKLIAPECVDDTPGRLALRIRSVRVLEMLRLDFNGKVFAYAAEYEPQANEKGISHRTLEFISVIFYDVDGSGLFKVMKYDYHGPFHSLEIPQWAKKPSP
jgi:hypothetical protein